MSLFSKKNNPKNSLIKNPKNRKGKASWSALQNGSKMMDYKLSFSSKMKYLYPFHTKEFPRNVQKTMNSSDLTKNSSLINFKS